MRSILPLLFLLAYTLTWAQTVPQVKIARSSGKITVDGVLDEAAWQAADVAKDFMQSKPYDTSAAVTKTEVMLTYDNQNLYIAAKCFRSITDQEYVVTSLKRDFSFPRNDAIQIVIDPFGDKTNGFSFGVHALGAQREGTLSNGGSFGVTTSWDNKWYSKVTQHPDKWIVEIAIPFKSIRFKDGSTKWEINFCRNDVKRNETSSWSRVPRNLNIASLAFCGDLLWDEPVKKTGTNISLIPYLAGNVSRDFTDTTQTSAAADYGAGLDAKIAITSSLNLDLTVNPDFSQVEVDRQVTNLSRFSIFFPERRPFFLENEDLFGFLGFSRIRPFFSRRIGIGFNSTTGINEPLPILGGARLSGKLNKDWRIGALTVTTPRNKDFNQPSQSYGMAIVQRQVGAASNISAFVVNRQALGTDSTSDVFVHPSDFNRVIGADFKFASADNKHRGILFYHHSLGSQNPGRQGATAGFYLFQTQYWRAAWNHEYIGRNYQADVGFILRTGVYRLEPSLSRTWYPKTDKVITRQVSIYNDSYFADSLTWIDGETRISYDQTQGNTANWWVNYREIYTLLRFDFDPSGSGGIALPAGSGYNYRRIDGGYSSDPRKRFTWYAAGQAGTYFNGERYKIEGSVGYRAQPWGIFSMSFEQNEIMLPDSFSNASWTLFGPRVELSLTKSLFFNLFTQFNAQASNMNINSRLQWRFAPMSDLFIVYTDNYLAESNLTDVDDLHFRILGKKNRTLVLKFVYWFSV